MDNSEARAASGKVKWYDPVKGYGFIQTDQLENDILIHAQVLRNSGWEILYQGISVDCEYVETERGFQAVSILHIDPEPLGRYGFSSDHQKITNIAEDGFVSACVKWYSELKGYGFLTFGIDKPDIFLHSEVVKRSGWETMSVGEIVDVRFSMRPQGLVALSLRSLQQEDKANVSAEGSSSNATIGTSQKINDEQKTQSSSPPQLREVEKKDLDSNFQESANVKKLSNETAEKGYNEINEDLTEYLIQSFKNEKKIN